MLQKVLPRASVTQHDYHLVCHLCAVTQNGVREDTLGSNAIADFEALSNLGCVTPTLET